MGLIWYVQNLCTSEYTAISRCIARTRQQPELLYWCCCHLEALAVVIDGMAAHGALRILIICMRVVIWAGIPATTRHFVVLNVIDMCNLNLRPAKLV